jgi:hypothetical protein
MRHSRIIGGTFLHREDADLVARVRQRRDFLGTGEGFRVEGGANDNLSSLAMYAQGEPTCGSNMDICVSQR